MKPNLHIPRTAYVVLGMHRSGTSSVAGSLVEMGARPPLSLMPPKADNPLGFWESERVANFSDEILTAAGSSWQDWGRLDPSVFLGRFADHFSAASRWLLQVEFGESPAIVLKDPRICRFYPFWRDTLQTCGFSPFVILPVRAPDQVARSLNRRNGLPVSLGFRLWLRHVLDAEYASRQDARLMATLDAFIADWPGRLSDLASQSRLELDIGDSSTLERIAPFWARDGIEPSSSDDIVLPDLVERTWAAFKTMSDSGDNKTARDRLDQVRDEFEALSALFHDPCTPQ
jgi:hypothetical protein